MEGTISMTYEGYLQLTHNDLKVILESFSGELGRLRFTVARMIPPDKWMIVEGGSACTGILNTIDHRNQEAMLRLVMDTVYPKWKQGVAIKRAVSDLSWVEPHDWKQYLTTAVRRSRHVVNPTTFLELIGSVPRITN
ncbi:MAG: hypothetical protein JRN62_03500 [Nitrososphaerota archaeon]|nr:hypothetical protein [Nitrososphaerota archaeon]